MVAAHSTVPRWPAQPPEVDATGRSYGLVGVGAAALQTVRRWQSSVPSRVEVWTLTTEGDPAGTLAALAVQLDRATVGFRLMVAGSERDVLAARAVAFEAGLLASEFRLHATSTSHRDLYCVHCHATSTVALDVEDVARCDGCGRGLMVFAHLSARTGSYLGYQADAEELV